MENNNPLPETQPQSTPLPTPTSQPPILEQQAVKQRGSLFPLIGALVILIIVGGGYYFVKVRSNTSPVQTPSVLPTQGTMPRTQSLPTALDQTANWKTFSSKTFSISYKYPMDWNNDNFCQGCTAQPIVESSNERYLHPLGIKYPVGITYSVDAKASSAPLSFFINSLKTRNLTSKTSRDLSVNESNGFEVIGNDENGKKIALAVFDNKDYIFQFTSSEEYINTLETLMSTVKFTDQIQADGTANLKTYSGQYVIFQYPSDWNPQKTQPFGGGVLETVNLGIPGVNSDQDLGFSEVAPYKPSDAISEQSITIGGKSGFKWIRKGQGYVSYDYDTKGYQDKGGFSVHVTVASENKTLETQLDQLVASLTFK